MGGATSNLVDGRCISINVNHEGIVAKINSKNENTDSGAELAGDGRFFPEAGRGKTLLHIVNLARFNPGIIMLMGDEGSGRSFLLHKLTLRVNRKPGLLVTIDQVVKTKSDLYRAIAESFSLDVVKNESADALEERVLDYLPGCFVTHRPVILAVDNIQQFSLSMLEELIKLLRKYKKISLLLIGDNNLAAMLKQLDAEKAVRHEITLPPQNRGEMRQFINWRLPFAIDDREFDDIVNTTKGNFALLEREAQKKELTHQVRQSSQDSRIVHFIRSKKSLLFMASLLVAITFAALFYVTHDESTPAVTIPPVSAKIAEPVPVSTSAADAGVNGGEMLDRQLELLTATPEDTGSDAKETVTKASEPDPVRKPVVVETKIAPSIVELPKPATEPKPVVVIATPVEPIAPAPAAVEASAVAAPVAVEKKVAASLAEDDAAKLLSMNARHYSIQLLGGESKKTIHRFMTEHSKLDKLFYFRSERDGKDWYIVMYGEFDNRQAAIQAAAELPDNLKKTSPWPRRLSEIHLLINARSSR